MVAIQACGKLLLRQMLNLTIFKIKYKRSNNIKCLIDNPNRDTAESKTLSNTFIGV